jgi:hypothetical protein
VEEPGPPPDPPGLRVRRAVESAGLDAAAPLVVVGLDGSGTEVGARIVPHAGVVLDDPAAMRAFAARWVPVLLEHRGRFEHVDDLDAMIEEFVETLDGPRADALWGWEDPESIHLLPFLRAAWARLRVLHLVGDVRDVAGDAEGARLWSDVNLDCADFGERVLRSAYLRVRLEDLVADPRAGTRQILRFVAGRRAIEDPERVAEAAAEVEAPGTLGRWRDEDPEAVADVAEAAAEGLERFGYTSSE